MDEIRDKLRCVRVRVISVYVCVSVCVCARARVCACTRACVRARVRLTRVHALGCACSCVPRVCACRLLNYEELFCRLPRARTWGVLTVLTSSPHTRTHPDARARALTHRNRHTDLRTHSYHHARACARSRTHRRSNEEPQDPCHARQNLVPNSRDSL